jgi:hypothetical protein
MIMPTTGGPKIREPTQTMSLHNSTRHNPTVGITLPLPRAAVTILLSRGTPGFSRKSVRFGQCLSQ